MQWDDDKAPVIGYAPKKQAKSSSENACGSEEVEWQVAEEKETEAESVTCDLCLKGHSELFSFCFPFLIHKKVFKDDIDQAPFDRNSTLFLLCLLGTLVKKSTRISHMFAPSS
jgi:hypothetical protein